MATYTEHDRIDGPSKGSPDAWYAWAVGEGCSRPGDVRQYLDTVYVWAPKCGLRAEMIVTQSIHETSMNGVPWASHWWKERCNPAGIGITGDPSQNAASRVFRNGVEAALAHIVHAHLYVQGTDLPEGLSPSMDPRWANAASVPSIVGKKKTLRSFGNAGETPTWAVDPQYGVKWSRQLNATKHLFERVTPPAPPVDPPKEPPMEVQFVKRIADNRLGQFGNLRDLLAYFTIHENGNPSSSPFDEAGFVRNGGGGGRVMYHFAVGVENGQPTIVQIFPVYKRGSHAGNSEGNATSIAVETCMSPPGATSDMTQAALRELCYMLFTGDPRIEGMDKGYKFSVDRTRRHGDWPGANPSCPQTMNAQWGGIQPVLTDVRARLAGSPQLPKLTISTGDIVKATTGLNVRMDATTSADIAYTLQADDEALVLDGPKTADGHTWWKLQYTASTGVGIGWSAEGDGWLVVVKDYVEPPKEEYVSADPIAELADNPGFLQLANGSKLVYLGRQAKVITATPQNRWAAPGSGKIGPDLKVGDTVMVDRLIINPDDSLYAYTDKKARVLLAHLQIQVPSA